MENFCFSIDEERYDDRHGHVLSLDGWYAHPERKVYELSLIHILVPVNPQFLRSSPVY